MTFIKQNYNQILANQTFQSFFQEFFLSEFTDQVFVINLIDNDYKQLLSTLKQKFEF